MVFTQSLKLDENFALNRKQKINFIKYSSAKRHSFHLSLTTCSWKYVTRIASSKKINEFLIRKYVLTSISRNEHIFLPATRQRICVRYARFVRVCDNIGCADTDHYILGYELKCRIWRPMPTEIDTISGFVYNHTHIAIQSSDHFASSTIMGLVHFAQSSYTKLIASNF